MLRPPVLLTIVIMMLGAFAAGMAVNIHGANPGDILAFAGALIGAAAAVIGSFAVSSWESKREVSDTINLWIEAIDDTLKILDYVSTLTGPQGVKVDLSASSCQDIEIAISRLIKITKLFPPKTIGMLRATDIFDGITVEVLPVIGDYIEGQNVTQKSENIITGGLAFRLSVAKAYLKGGRPGPVELPTPRPNSPTQR